MLGPGGFDGGDRASRVLVDCPGQSAELMEALLLVMEGLSADTEAMDVFTPLVSAEITRRTALEGTGELPELEDTVDAAPQASPDAPPPVENPEPALGEATIDAPAEEKSRFGPARDEVERKRWVRLRKERLAKAKQASGRRVKLEAEDAWIRKTWRTRLATFAPLVALAPSTGAAVWVAFLGGYQWMVAEDLDGLLLYATLPTLSALGGAVVGALVDRQAGLSALVIAPVLGISFSSVAIIGYERAVQDAMFSASMDPIVLFAAAGVTWGIAALAGLRGTT